MPSIVAYRKDQRSNRRYRRALASLAPIVYQVACAYISPRSSRAEGSEETSSHRGSEESRHGRLELKRELGRVPPLTSTPPSGNGRAPRRRHSPWLRDKRQWRPWNTCCFPSSLGRLTRFVSSSSSTFPRNYTNRRSRRNRRCQLKIGVTRSRRIRKRVRKRC